MTVVRRYLIVRESRIAAINGFLDNHPDLDIRGGGGKSFTVPLQLTTDPPQTTRGRLACWLLPSEWTQIILDNYVPQAWKINSTDTDNDLSHYNAANWTLQEVLDDVTRKPFAVQLVPQGV